MSPPHALIAGAGVGGLGAALCLARRGFRVTILERAAILEEAGAGLQLSPNASAILRDWGVLPRLKHAALVPRAIRVRRARDGSTLSLMPLDGAEERWGAPYLVAHRGDLQRALLEEVAHEPAISLRTGTALAGFAAKGDGVAVTAKYGRISLSFEADCLIGADGVRSLVRERLVDTPTASRMTSRRTAWRAMVEAERLPAALRQPETVLWLGRAAHLVHYPLRGASVVNVVAIVDESLRIDAASDIWSLPGEAAQLAARFAGWDRAATLLLDSANSWRRWPLFDHAPLPRWSVGRVALLGDAAHPMLPFLAQGAAQAIEDADALGRALSGNPSIEQGFAAYQAVRQARAGRVQATARRLGSIYHLAGPAALARDLAMRAMGPERMLAGYDWLYRAAG